MNRPEVVIVDTGSANLASVAPVLLTGTFSGP